MVLVHTVVDDSGHQYWMSPLCKGCQVHVRLKCPFSGLTWTQSNTMFLRPTSLPQMASQLVQLFLHSSPMAQCTSVRHL